MLEEFEIIPAVIFTFCIVILPIILMMILSYIEEKETDELIDNINYKNSWNRKMNDETLNLRLRKYR